jgi:hypothetical protein
MFGVIKQSMAVSPKLYTLEALRETPRLQTTRENHSSCQQSL